MKETLSPHIESSWFEKLQHEFRQDYFSQLKMFLMEEKKKGKVFPPGSQIFRAFDTTPFYQVKAVIIGQDPYHGLGQANGLCFAVNKGIPIPPSLKNIYKEQESDLGIKQPAHGDLTEWAEHGVLLLNATLTVRKSEAGSHQNRGWEHFTDAAIKSLSRERERLVFILWGRFAQAKETLIDSEKHLILKAAHPSPFSAYNGFFGCKHFSKTNAYLNRHGIAPVNWQLT